MDVVRHQAIPIHPQGEPLPRVSQKLQIDLPVRVHEEYVLMIAAPLNNMVGTTSNHNSCISRHGSISTPSSTSVNPKT
jgi:hypothetical protein